MGCTLLYKMDDAFVEKHINDRKRKDKDDGTTLVSMAGGLDYQNDLNDIDITKPFPEFATGGQVEGEQGLGIEAQVQLLSKMSAASNIVDEEITMLKLNVPPPQRIKNSQ